MTAHVLLNLLNKLGKRDNSKACQEFYHIFAASLIVINTRARMQDSI